MGIVWNLVAWTAGYAVDFEGEVGGVVGAIVVVFAATHVHDGVQTGLRFSDGYGTAWSEAVAD